MESFQQSGLNTSRHSFLTRSKSDEARQFPADCDVSGENEKGIASGGEASMRENAKTSEMKPLRISFIRTAVAAEYARDGGVDTLE